MRNASDSGGFSPGQRLAWLRRHGSHCTAAGGLQPGMRWHDVPGKGYVAYRCWGSRVLAVGDPVCPVADRPEVLASFLRRFPHGMFVQVSPAVAAVARALHGGFATALGCESRLDPVLWRCTGRRGQVIRTAVNRARREGVVVGEEPLAAGEREALSRRWLATRRCARREIGFLVRPAAWAGPGGARSFAARSAGGRLLGWVLFDPVWRDGRVSGYVPNVSRASREFPAGIFYVLMCEAIARFREEGVRDLHLGLWPAHPHPGGAGRHESTAYRALLSALRRCGGGLYDFAGVAFTKSRFGGELRPSFAVHRAPLPLLSSLGLLRLCRVL